MTSPGGVTEAVDGPRRDLVGAFSSRPLFFIVMMTFIPGRAVGNKSDHGHESISDDVNRIESPMEPRLQNQT